MVTQAFGVSEGSNILLNSEKARVLGPSLLHNLEEILSMIIVIRPAARANRTRSQLPICNQTNIDAETCSADGPSKTPGHDIGPTAPGRIRSPPDPRDYISGYDQLLRAGVAFYPIHPDKSPAVEGKLNRAVTTDPFKIRFWAEHRQHNNFAFRIPSSSRLFVIDTDSPFKYRDRPGPDGEMFFCGLLEDHDIRLPPCPTVQTPSIGFHRYYLMPKGFRVRTAIGLWPGVDILAAGSNVILPGSRTESGEYRELRSFRECPIPEAPRALVKLIREAERTKRNTIRSVQKRPLPLSMGDGPEVSSRQWWLLFRNRVFRSFWSRTAKLGDTTDSAYEYHIAKACFCCGLTERQAIAVIVKWRCTHRLKRSLRQLRSGIIPAAWREVSPWVERWQANSAAAQEARNATKTSSVILAYIAEVGMPQSPASIAAALPIPRERAKKAMQRLVKLGRLAVGKEGYTIGALALGTFSCITTPL